MKRRLILVLFLLVQAICTILFLADILISVLDLPVPPLSWETHEVIEVSAAFGLLLGFGLSATTLRRALAESRDMRLRLHRAQSEFQGVMNQRFVDWGLTPAESDVALFAVKGMTTAEIALMRKTSEGTIKAQSNAIYRKAGVVGRSQLLSLFIEDLVDGIGIEPPEAATFGTVPR